jgi:hypothetical protein
MKQSLNRTLILNTLIRHETLTIGDIAKEENLGIIPDLKHVDFLVSELTESGHIQQLDGAIPPTFTITTKGIEEGERLSREAIQEEVI